MVECPPAPGSALCGPPAALASAPERLARGRRRPRAFRRDPTLQMLGAELPRARVAAGLAQREVARRMWTTQSAVSRLERGRATWPSLSAIERCALAVGRRIELRLHPDWRDRLGLRRELSRRNLAGGGTMRAKQ